MKLYIIDLPGHNVPDRAFSSKQEAVKAARAALKAECEEEREQALGRVEYNRYNETTEDSVLNALEREAKALRPEPFGPADLQCVDLPATKAGLIIAYEAGFGDGAQHGESI
jgi:hypothetical protein